MYWLMNRPGRYLYCIEEYSDYDDGSLVVKTRRDVTNLSNVEIISAKIGEFDPCEEGPFNYQEVPINGVTKSALENFVKAYYEYDCLESGTMLFNATKVWQEYIYELAKESSMKLFTYKRTIFSPFEYENDKYEAFEACQLSAFASGWFNDLSIDSVFVCKNLMIYVKSESEVCGVYLPLLRTLSLDNPKVLDAIDYFVHSVR